MNTAGGFCIDANVAQAFTLPEAPRFAGARERSGSGRASVTRGTGGRLDASFQVGLIDGRNLQVRLEVFDGRIRETISGLSVPIERRATLELPERPPIGNR